MVSPSGKKARVKEERTNASAMNEFLQVTKEDINDWTTKAQMELEVSLPLKKQQWKNKSGEMETLPRKVQSIEEALDGFLTIDRVRVTPNTVYLNKKTPGDDLLAASESKSNPIPDLLWNLILIQFVLLGEALKHKEKQDQEQQAKPTLPKKIPDPKEDLATKLMRVNEELLNSSKKKDPLVLEEKKDDLEDAIDALFQTKKEQYTSAPRFSLNLDDTNTSKYSNHPRVDFDEDALVEHVDIKMSKVPPEPRFTFRPSACVS
jgi:flagellar hook-basal body complex protein FliE